MPYRDIEDGRAKRRQHYRDNKELYLARSAKRRMAHRETLRAHVRAVKAGQRCIACREAHHYSVMDFHHRGDDDKDATIAKMCHKGVPLQRLIDEIAKCDLMCANCHRFHHWGDAATPPE